MLAPNRRDSSLDYTRPANFAGKCSAELARQYGQSIFASPLACAPCFPYHSVWRSPAGVAATGDTQPRGSVPPLNEARAAKFAGAVRSLNEQFLQWARSQWTAGKSGRFWSNGMLDYLRHSAIIRRDFADVPAAQGGARPDHTVGQASTLLGGTARQHISILLFVQVPCIRCAANQRHCRAQLAGLRPLKALQVCKVFQLSDLQASQARMQTITAECMSLKSTSSRYVKQRCAALSLSI